MKRFYMRDFNKDRYFQDWLRKQEEEKKLKEEKRRKRIIQENRERRQRHQMMMQQQLMAQMAAFNDAVTNASGATTGSGSGGSVSLDRDVRTFLDVTEINDATITTALNTFVTTLKTERIWDDTIALYPFVTDKTDAVDIQSQFKYNVKDPQDTDAAYRLTTFGSVIFNTTGIITGANSKNGGRLQTHTSLAGASGGQMFHRESVLSLQGYWNSTAQIFHSGQYTIVGGGELGAHIYGRVDDNTFILCGPLAHRTGVSDGELYDGDYVVSSIGGVITPGASQYFAGYYLRTNSDLDWQVIEGDFIGRTTFSAAFNANEISLYIVTNPISKEQTLTLQTAINQLQTDLGRATH